MRYRGGEQYLHWTPAITFPINIVGINVVDILKTHPILQLSRIDRIAVTRTGESVRHRTTTSQQIGTGGD